MKTNLFTTSFSIAVLALALGIFAIGVSLYQHPQTAKADSGYPNYFGNSTTTPPLATSTSFTLGPSASTRVLATSTSRVFAYLSTAGNQPIFCNMDQDASETPQTGFVVGTSTPFTINLNDLYIGSIQCMSNGTATLSVTAYQ